MNIKKIGIRLGALTLLGAASVATPASARQGVGHDLSPLSNVGCFSEFNGKVINNRCSSGALALYPLILDFSGLINVRVRTYGRQVACAVDTIAIDGSIATRTTNAASAAGAWSQDVSISFYNGGQIARLWCIVPPNNEIGSYTY